MATLLFGTLAYPAPGMNVRLVPEGAAGLGLTTTTGTLPQWLGAVGEVEQLTDGPLRVGTRIRADGKMPGRHMDTFVEVTALEPGARLAFTGALGAVQEPQRLHVRERCWRHQA